jgi:uncharacterized caspase-like protein
MRHWAISIGINQYEFLQPLSYAQHDAQAMHRFLIERGAFRLNNASCLQKPRHLNGAKRPTPIARRFKAGLTY